MRASLQFPVGIVIGTFVVIAIFSVGGALATWSCDSAWNGSGFDHRWRYGGGCQVKIHDKFVPEDAVRTIRIDQL